MAEVVFQEKLWNGFVQVARRHRQKPEALAAKLLRDFVQRQADEDLLARSEQAARRSGFRVEETEEVLRQYRRRKKKS